MMRTAVSIALALCAVAAFSAVEARGADEPLTAAACTLRGRSLDRSLDEVLSPGTDGDGKARTVLFVVDPSPALKTAGFARSLRAAVGRAGDKLADTRLGVIGAMPKAKPILCAAGEPVAALDAVDALLSSPRSQFADVFEATRRGVKAFGGKKSARHLVLVTLDNGDVESDVEAAVRALRKAHVTFSVLTWQAFLSDSYWAYRGSEAPRGMTPRGGEAAFVQVPWGFIFQNAVANEHTGSGFAAFGLSRLAASVKGRVFLFDDGKSREHKCTVVGTTCTFCDADHLPDGTAYQTGLLSGLAPVVNSRKVALARAARDPYFKATLAAWEAATAARLVRSAPGVKRSGGSLKSSGSATSSRMAELGRTLGFQREARTADGLAKECGAIAKRLRAAIDAVSSDEGSPRQRATAETTYALLRLTRVNLLGFAAWCREVGPVQVERRDAEQAFPEYRGLSKGFRPSGVSFAGFSACHGVKPFLRQRWPGGESFRAELEELSKVFDRLLAKYAHTPYGTAIRRSSLARFHLAGVGKYVPPPPRERPDEEGDDTTTGSDRTPRGDAGGGSSDGPTTGDK